MYNVSRKGDFETSVETRSAGKTVFNKHSDMWQNQNPVNRQRSSDQQMDINWQGREDGNQGADTKFKNTRLKHQLSYG